ncbi:MAG: hypothetical protein B6U78_02970 [Candidatus Aenigmarchaeota archaeon ex4484_224]|nr:MAG: hypothetical protein B6U78_02970 [Candidatus Aenigmarchaeota archaeon ex4484_224]
MEILPYLQSVITILSIITGSFAIAQIRLLLKRKTAKDISLIYQSAVWLNATFCFIVFTLIGMKIGFDKIYGNIFCSLECFILVGTIVFLICYYRWKEKRERRSKNDTTATNSSNQNFTI